MGHPLRSQLRLNFQATSPKQLTRQSGNKWQHHYQHSRRISYSLLLFPVLDDRLLVQEGVSEGRPKNSIVQCLLIESSSGTPRR